MRFHVVLRIIPFAALWLQSSLTITPASSVTLSSLTVWPSSLTVLKCSGKRNERVLSVKRETP